MCQAIVVRVYQNEIDKKNKESILTNNPSFGGLKGVSNKLVRLLLYALVSQLLIAKGNINISDQARAGAA